MTSEAESGGDGTGQALVARELKRYRERAGLSQNKLAKLVGYSRAYIWACEKPGATLASEEVARRVDDELGAGGVLVELRARAHAQHIARRVRGSPTAYATPGAYLPIAQSTWPRTIHAVVPAIRRAMQEVSFAPMTIIEPVSPADLDRRVRRAWLMWHTSPAPRTDVGELLPDLIRDAHSSVRAHDRTDRRRAQAATGDLYRLVQRLLAHVAEPELHALAVERGRAMSEAADRPNSLALAAWSSAIAASALGHFDEAVRISDAGIGILQALADAGSPEILGVTGALQSEAAAALAFSGRGDAAFAYMNDASSAAVGLPARHWHLQSSFSTASIEILSVIIDVTQGRIAESIRRAEQINPLDITSLVRRSRLLLEMAVAHAHRREPFAAVHYLELAVNTSPEAIAPIPWAIDLAAELVRMAPPTLRGPAMALAARFATLTTS